MIDMHRFGYVHKWVLKAIDKKKRIPDSDNALIFEYIRKHESKYLNMGCVAKYAYYLKNMRL